MLINLAQWLQTLSPEFGFFRVFQYLTFRAVMAALTALLIGLIAGPFVIRRLVALKIGQPIREYAMQTHLSKSGTPTMGGVLVLLAIAIATCCGPTWATVSCGLCCWSRWASAPSAGPTTGAKWFTKTPRVCARATSIYGSPWLGCWLRCTWCSVFLKAPTCGYWNFS